MSFDDEFNQIMNQGRRIEHAKDRYPTWLEAFNCAHNAGRLNEAMLARYYHTLDATPFDPDAAIVSFVWCSGHLEHDQFVDATRIVSLYGTITRLLYEDPKYPMEQLEKTWDQMREKFLEYGFEESRLWYHRLYGEIAVANDEKLLEVVEKWKTSGSRDLQICTWATEQDIDIYFENHEAALVTGNRALKSGLTCSHHHPTVIRFENLVPLLELDRLDEAKEQFLTAELSLERMHNNRMWCAARAIFYLASVGNLDRGAWYFSDCYKLVIDGGSPADHHRFFTASIPFLRRCSEDGYDATRMLAEVGFEGESVEQLEHEIESHARFIAADFDRRHGNDWYTRMIDRYLALYERVKN